MKDKHIINCFKLLYCLKVGCIISRDEIARELNVTNRTVTRYKNILSEFICIESISGPYGGYKLISRNKLGQFISE